MRVPRRRSRCGCSATSRSSSLTSPACRPSASLASQSASRQAIRSSSSRAISPCANSSYATSSSGEPRHSASACSSGRSALFGSPAVSSARPSSRRLTKRSASTSSARRLEHVAATARAQPIGFEQLAQPGDVRLQALVRRRRLHAAVQVFEQPIGRNDLVAAQQQDREKRALPRAAEFQRTPIDYGLERPKDSKVHTPRNCL